MFPLANMFHFFAHKLARLGRRRFAFALVFARAFKSFFFWHSKSVSPLATHLDVEDSVVARQVRLLRPPTSKSLRRSPNQLYGYKRIAIPRWANLVSAHAHNSVTDPAHPVTRRVAHVAVQLRMGVLSKRRLGTYPFDCADFVADGAYLTTPRWQRLPAHLSSNQLFLEASRSCLMRSCASLIWANCRATIS